MPIKDLKVRVRRRVERIGPCRVLRIASPFVAMLLVWTALAAQPPSASAATALTAAEHRVVELINVERAARGLPGLRVRTSLCRAADRHSQDMLRRDYFSHRCPGGRTLATRCRLAGYSDSGCFSWRVAENIAWGRGLYRTPEMVVAAWMKSKAHRQLILDPALWEIGVGRARGTYRGSPNTYMTTADFGRRLRTQDDVAGAPSIEDLTFSDSHLTRRSDDSRQSCRIEFSVDEPVRVKVSVCGQDGSLATTVREWRWMPAGSHGLEWDGRLAFEGVKVPAPDGTYEVRIETRDLVGTRSTKTRSVSCTSPPGQEASFVTAATRNFRVRRGSRAVFRFTALYLPPLGEQASHSSARLVLKIRTAKGTSCYTRVWESVALNTVRRFVMPRCRFSRGTYRYYLLARLPDGTRQQLYYTGRMIVR